MDNSKKTFIVANWKSNKTESEAKEWFSAVSILREQDLSNKEIIVCPSFVYLFLIKSIIKEQKLSVKLGSQDISSLGEGAYTGEINGKQVKESADYVIVGHSERRNNFKETDEALFKKFKLAKEAGLNVIYCIQGKETKIPENADTIAYEPVCAIGTGNPDTPENADKVGAYFKANSQVINVLYGGSVTADNVDNFTQMPNLNGVLVGKASLDPSEFLQIIKNA
jgi:triosephosphate isomerase (TIM)